MIKKNINGINEWIVKDGITFADLIYFSIIGEGVEIEFSASEVPNVSTDMKENIEEYLIINEGFIKG